MSLSISDRTLRQHLARALDPGRREEVEAALAASADLRARLALLIATTTGPELSPWRLPPPGARMPWAIAADLSAGAAMGEEDSLPGDYLELRYEVEEGQAEHRLVLLQRAQGQDWEVLFPAAPGEDRPLRAYPREADGRIRLDLAVADTGTGSLALAFIPPSWTVDWTLPPSARWMALQEALGRGALPVRTLRPPNAR